MEKFNEVIICLNCNNKIKNNKSLHYQYIVCEKCGNIIELFDDVEITNNSENNDVDDIESYKNDEHHINKEEIENSRKEPEYKPNYKPIKLMISIIIIIFFGYKIYNKLNVEKYESKHYTSLRIDPQLIEHNNRLKLGAWFLKKDSVFSLTNNMSFRIPEKYSLMTKLMGSSNVAFAAKKNEKILLNKIEKIENLSVETQWKNFRNNSFMKKLNGDLNYKRVKPADKASKYLLLEYSYNDTKNWQYGIARIYEFDDFLVFIQYESNDFNNYKKLANSLISENLIIN